MHTYIYICIYIYIYQANPMHIYTHNFCIYIYIYIFILFSYVYMNIFEENHIYIYTCYTGIVVSLRLSHALTAKSTLYATAGTEPGDVWPYLLGEKIGKSVSKIFAECFTAYPLTFALAWQIVSVTAIRRRTCLMVESCSWWRSALPKTLQFGRYMITNGKVIVPNFFGTSVYMYIYIYIYKSNGFGVVLSMGFTNW